MSYGFIGSGANLPAKGLRHRIKRRIYPAYDYRRVGGYFKYEFCSFRTQKHNELLEKDFGIRLSYDYILKYTNKAVDDAIKEAVRFKYSETATTINILFNEDRDKNLTLTISFFYIKKLSHKNEKYLYDNDGCRTPREFKDFAQEREQSRIKDNSQDRY